MTSTTSTLFTRLVVALENGDERGDVRRAAELARQLRAELHGVLSQDPRLAALAGFETLREFRVLERAWSATSGPDLAEAMATRAEATRTMLHEACAAAGVAAGFEVVHAPVGEAISSVVTASDIVLISYPGAASDGAAETLHRIEAIVGETSAAVLLVPSVAPARPSGRVRPANAPPAVRAPEALSDQFAGLAIVVERDLARALDIVARGVTPVLIPNLGTAPEAANA